MSLSYTRKSYTKESLFVVVSFRAQQICYSMHKPLCITFLSGRETTNHRMFFIETLSFLFQIALAFVVVVTLQQFCEYKLYVVQLSAIIRFKNDIYIYEEGGEKEFHENLPIFVKRVPIVISITLARHIWHQLLSNQPLCVST